MVTKILISAILDRKKAMAWLRAKTDWTLDTISKQLSSPLPVLFSFQELDVKQYLTYAHEWGLDEIERVYYQGLLIPHAGCKAISTPIQEECGFTTTTETLIAPEEHVLFVEKIEELTEIKEAQKWYDDQPDDIKRKIALIRPRPPQG